ncbi:MAG: peroxiredoxin [Alphaproteobacteria bacterium]|nr:peroxiredoxin [Alphaproteobacteria bacterium]
MIIVGQTFPKGIHLKSIRSGVIEDFSTDELWNGKYILFAVPGAFTPTCSNQHLPSYMKAGDVLNSKGIKDIVCIAVNDHFVMQAWAESQQVGDTITLLADGSGILTKALDMELDVTAHGLGMRSKRYSMVIDNGVVTALYVEENPGECTVSHATHLAL